MHKLSGGKKIRNLREKLELQETYELSKAIDILRGSSFVKFDPTLEVVLKLGIDVKRSDQVVRGMVNMPSGTGKTLRVAVICKDERFDEAKEAKADLVGNADIIDDIKKGIINFDVCITTPDMMGMIGQVARVLGPKGLMPNPKLGTVTTDIASAITAAKAGQVEFKADKGGIVHAGVGKLSFDNNALAENINAFFAAVLKAKPAASKGEYVRKAFISSTMMPALKLDFRPFLVK